MAVAADDGCAGQRKALFWPDDMDDALFAVCRADIADAECGGVGFQCRQLRGAFGVGDGDAVALCIFARSGRQVMVRDRQCQVGPAHSPSGIAQPLKGLRAGDFMHQMPVDKDQAGAIFASGDDMRVPDFLV